MKWIKIPAVVPCNDMNEASLREIHKMFELYCKM